MDSGEKARPIHRPSRDQYLSNPRSAQIRAICVDSIRDLESIMRGRDALGNPISETDTYAKLEKYNGKLIELGITPKIHVGDPLETFADPVISAEFVAGQIVPLLGKRIVKEETALMLGEEYSDEHQGLPPMLSGKDAPDKLVDYAVAVGITSAGQRQLDIKPEELNEFKKKGDIDNQNP